MLGGSGTVLSETGFPSHGVATSCAPHNRQGLYYPTCLNWHSTVLSAHVQQGTSTKPLLAKQSLPAFIASYKHRSSISICKNIISTSTNQVALNENRTQALLLRIGNSEGAHTSHKARHERKQQHSSLEYCNAMRIRYDCNF